MDNLPFYIYLVFGLTISAAIALFYKATNGSKLFLILISAWILSQSIVGMSGFYTVTNTVPPRFGLLVLPPLILTIVLFSRQSGQQFIDSLDIKWLTLFHTIRVPVELVLYWLFMQKTIPELMTFEGRNFDILSGISVPIIYYFGFVKQNLSKKVLILWNFVCLALLVNIVTHAILSVPTPFQKLAFEQPNVAILYFPFLLLPACLVPLVLFAHLASLRQLFKLRL